MAAPATLEVRRHRVEYRVSSRHSAPQRVRRALDATVSSLLESALASAAAPLFRPDSEEIWMLRGLRVDLALDASARGEALARHWAARIARALERAFRSGGPDVIRFADPSDYLARFLYDSARGEAGKLWYYQPFQGLSVLPLPAALRTALLDKPEVGAAALRLLDPLRRAAVLRALGPEEALRVLRDMAKAGGAQAERVPDIAALPGLAEPPLWVAAEADALDLYLRWTESLPEAGGPALAALALGAAALRRLAAGSPAALRELAEGRSASFAALPPSLAEPLASLLSGPPEARRNLIRPFLARVSGPARAGGISGADAERRRTAFGGLFMLLPFLEALPLEEASAGWPVPAHAAPLPVLRLSLLARAAGALRFASVFGDSLWRDLLGVAPEFAEADRRAWLEAVPGEAARVFARDAAGKAPAPFPAEEETYWLPQGPVSPVSSELAVAEGARALLRGFARRLRGFASSSPAYLYDNFLDVPASLECAGGRRIVRLGRPPLDLILGMTSLARGRFHPAWMEGPALELFREDEGP